MTEVAPGVFVVDRLFTRAVRSFWFTEAEIQRLKTERPNSMNKYGVILGGDLWPALSRLVEDVVWPVARDHYPEFAGGLRRRPYAFTIDYDCAAGRQRSLARHFDTSDVTLNVCLSFAGAGGNLVVYHGRKRTEIEHLPGRAIIHRGSLEHRALPLTDGARTNLVLWCAARKARK